MTDIATLSVLLRLRDEASGGLTKVDAALKGVSTQAGNTAGETAQVGASLDKVSSAAATSATATENTGISFKRAGLSARELGGAISRSGLGLAAGLEALTLIADRTGEPLDKLSIAARSLGFGLMMIPGPTQAIGVGLQVLASGLAVAKTAFGLANPAAEAHKQGIKDLAQIYQRLNAEMALTGKVSAVFLGKEITNVARQLNQEYARLNEMQIQGRGYMAEAVTQSKARIAALEEQLALMQAQSKELMAAQTRAEETKEAVKEIVDAEAERLRIALERRGFEVEAQKAMEEAAQSSQKWLEEEKRKGAEYLAILEARAAAEAKTAADKATADRLAGDSLHTVQAAAQFLRTQGYEPLADSILQYAALLGGDLRAQQEAEAARMGISISGLNQYKFAIIAFGAEAKRIAAERAAAESYAHNTLVALWQSELAITQQINDVRQAGIQIAFQAQLAEYNRARSIIFQGEKRPQFLMEQMWAQGATPGALVEQFGALAQQFLTKILGVQLGPSPLLMNPAAAAVPSFADLGVIPTGNPYAPNTIIINMNGNLYGMGDFKQEVAQAVRDTTLAGGFPGVFQRA